MVNRNRKKGIKSVREGRKTEKKKGRTKRKKIG